jgi:hypothetical protein
VPCKHLLDFTVIVFALEMVSENKKRKTYPIPNGPSPEARPGPPAPARYGPAASPARPIGQPEAEPAWPWPPPPWLPRAQPHKRGGQPARRPSRTPAPCPPPPPPCYAARSPLAPPPGSRAGELANRPRLTFEIRPPPSVSTVGEHVYMIPSISSLCFGFHPCPSSPVAPAICCARTTHWCGCAPVHLWIEPEVEDEAVLRLDPWRKRKSLPLMCVLYLLWKTPYENPTFTHKAHLSPFIDLTPSFILFTSTVYCVLRFFSATP